jgi:uncharacterized protein YdcH (DUF465 family)
VRQQLQHKDEIISMKDEMIELLKTQQQVYSMQPVVSNGDNTATNSKQEESRNRKISVKDSITNKLNK